MWEAATIIFTSLTVVTLVAIEPARSIVHRRRERRDGVGGTQDVAMIGVGIASIFALVGIVSLVIQGCSKAVAAAPPSTQPISTTAPSPRPADHLDVMSLVVRDLIVTHGPPTDREAQFVFLGLDGAHDPPPQLMERLGDDKRVVPLSKANRNTTPVTHVDGTGHGILLGVETIAWRSDHTADVTASWYWGPVAAGGFRYRVVRRDGEWSVIERESLWIS